MTREGRTRSSCFGFKFTENPEFTGNLEVEKYWMREAIISGFSTAKYRHSAELLKPSPAFRL
jgi:hypothetical protein